MNNVKSVARYDATRTAKDLLKALGHDDMPPNWTAKMQEDFEASVARIIQQDIKAAIEREVEAALAAAVREAEERTVERLSATLTSDFKVIADIGFPQTAIRLQRADAARDARIAELEQLLAADGKMETIKCAVSISQDERDQQWEAAIEKLAGQARCTCETGEAHWCFVHGADERAIFERERIAAELRRMKP